MPSLDKIPKDAIFLTANDVDDFLKWQDVWTKNGWLIGSDYQDGFYSAIALNQGRIMLLGYKDKTAHVTKELSDQLDNQVLDMGPITMPQEPETEINEGEAAEAEAIQRMHDLSG